MNGVGANIEHTPSKGSGSKLSLGEVGLTSPVSEGANLFDEMLALDEVEGAHEAPQVSVDMAVTDLESAHAEGDVNKDNALSGAELENLVVSQYPPTLPEGEVSVEGDNGPSAGLTPEIETTPLNFSDVTESVEPQEASQMSEAENKDFDTSSEHVDAPQTEPHSSDVEIDPIAGLATAAVVDEPVSLPSGAALQNPLKRAETAIARARAATDDDSGEGGFGRNALAGIPATLDGEQLLDEAEHPIPLAFSQSKTFEGAGDDNRPRPVAPNFGTAEPVVEATKDKAISPPSDLAKAPEAQAADATKTAVMNDVVDADDALLVVQRMGAKGTQIPFAMSENTPDAELQTMPESKTAEGDVKTDVTKIKLTLDGDFAQDGSIKAESDQKQPTGVNVSGPSILEMKGRDLLQASTTQPETQQLAAKDVLPKAALALSLRDAQWGQRLVAQIQKMHTEGSARYEISLRPKNLGDMNVTLEVRGEETQVRIVTETTAASRVLIGAENRLSQMLDAAGFKLSSLSASMGASSHLGNGQGQSSSKHKQHDMPGKSKMRQGAAPEVTAHRTNATQSGAVNVLA
ncbi:Flagellar hook-length control protein FliK [Nereida ignava]|uniref:Flagellar hook-length control protein FliK n=1 Tax=Nereida ignava TaxID=282199 RepID=A0A0U1NMZ6_9RHOB|nr:flagellar hook-length control protein FliK [Nereida ignava]CRK76125.1 Flagellar hook-length control protein FliK [Nereida ignava]SFJ56670.1 hook-length control protein FliK [Nereida ignava DSM 16309]